MRVICDNCGAVYRIPDQKLTKPVNKATCRKCGYKMLIPRAKPEVDPEEQTLISPAMAKEKQPPGLHEEKTVPEISPPKPELSATPPRNIVTPKATDLPGKTAAELDPSADMLWALLGITCAMVGSLILATNAHIVSNWLGLFLTLGGGFAALFVILTTGRGRHAGKPILSIGIGVGLSLFVATTFISLADLAKQNPIIPALIGWTTDTEAPAEVEEAPSEPEGSPEASDKTEDNADADADADAENNADAEQAAEEKDDEVQDDDEADDTGASDTWTPESVKTAEASPGAERSSDTPPAAKAEAPAKPAPASAPAPAKWAPAKPAPAKPAPASAPAPAPASNSSAMSKIPHTLTHTILTNNNDIKRCFLAHMKATGALPGMVGLQFKVMSNGRVSSARVTSAGLSSTPLSACLSSTINKLQFPPISSASQVINYNFVLN